MDNNNPQIPNNQNVVPQVETPTVTANEQPQVPTVEPPTVNGPVVAPPTVGNSNLNFNEEDGKILVPIGLEPVQPITPQTETIQAQPEPAKEENIQPTPEVPVQPQNDGILENAKMEKVEINYTPPSKFKMFVMFFMIAAILASIIFMPEINKLVDKLKEEKEPEVKEEEIMNGTLSCSYQTNNDKFDLLYSGIFNFSNRQLQSLTYTYTTKGDQIQDSTALQTLFANCKALDTDLQTKSYGVKVSCDITGGTVKIDETIDYSSYNSTEAEKLFKNYDIELADFEADQNIGDIENELKHSNYICFMESKSE